MARDKERCPGHVRGFDVRSGKQLWFFLADKGEFGVNAWEDDSWKYSGKH